MKRFLLILFLLFPVSVNAAVTYRTSVAGGSTSGTSDRTVAITPAVGDLFVVACFVSTNTNNTPTVTDNNSGTYTMIDVANVVISTVDHRLSLHVRNSLLPNTTSTTVTCGTGSNTSGIIYVVAVSGMLRTGASAIRSKGKQDNQAAGTPAPTLDITSLTTNFTLSISGSADTATLPNASWTERHDTTFATPTIASEINTRDSGFTGTTITFGDATSTTFASMAIELDGSAIPFIPRRIITI
jgi:hypothetical protein